MAAIAHDEAPDMDELKAGTALLHGQYRIESFLSSGGFGMTYLARDSLDRKVVIKECFPSAFCRRAGTTVAARSRAHQSEFRSIVKLFVREAWSLSKLTHPNIVGVHQVFEDNDTAYMALDYIDGYDLLQTIEDESLRLSPGEICNVLHKIVDAVGFVHDQDMLHRDISPDNILIDRKTGNPVLIDFGAAREKASEVHRALSELRVVKDGYSPQEFYINGSTQGPYSDLYALAATFYHLIQGTPPVPAQERLLAIASEETDPYVPLGSSNDGYEPAFLEAINQALHILPRDRLQSTREWQRMISPGAAAEEDVALASNVTSLPGAQAPGAMLQAVEAGDAPADTAPPRRTSKMPILLASTAAITIAGGLAVAYGGFIGGTVAEAPAERVAPSAAPDIPAAAPGRAEVTPAVPAAASPDAPPAAVEIAAAEAPRAAEPTDAQSGQAAPAVQSELPAQPAPLTDAAPPAATLDVAPGQASEALAPVAALPAALALPDAADEIALAPSARETAPPPAPAAAAAPAAAVESAPDPAPASAPLSTDLAMAVVTETVGLYLPFSHDDTAATTIARPAPDAEDWMAAGQRIVEVNGQPIRAFEDIPAQLRAEIEAAVAAGQPTVDAVLGVEAFPGAPVIRKSLTLAIVPEITVARGATFQILPTGAGPRPVVTDVPWNSETELQVGDIIQTYLARDEQIPAGTDFRELLLREIALGTRLLNFAASRNGDIWLVSLKVETGR